MKNINEISKKERKEIKAYLKELGCCIGYNDRIEELMEVFNIDHDAAESFVWDKASGLNQL